MRVTLQTDRTDATFGVLNIKTPPEAPLSTEQAIVITVDVSGSMSDPCGDGRSQMDHAKHTLKNLHRMFADHPGSVSASVTGFDDLIKPIILWGPVTPLNVAQCLTGIDTLLPCGGTNIELALTHAATVITDMAQTAPTVPITHIFLTDGCATTGCVDTAQLAPLVNPQASNLFIGYGTNHNPELLNTLGARPQAAYFFIDQIEKTGLVLGEIFHGIFYKRYTGVTLHGTNCVFYDFRTNTWVPTLHVDAWTSDTDKTYHFRSTGDAAEIHITGRDVHTGLEGALAAVPVATAPLTNLQRYLFRQRTQEIMYQAAHNRADPAIPLKSGLTGLLAEIKAYMTANALTQDPFYLSLCDDLVITLRTYGTQHGYMFAVGRINSNGYERTYNVCSLPLREPVARSQGIGRCASVAPSQVRFELPSAVEDADANSGAVEDGYTLSTESVNAVRLTPSMNQAMRSASQVIN
jgi:hypothetical protein